MIIYPISSVLPPIKTSSKSDLASKGVAREKSELAKLREMRSAIVGICRLINFLKK
jgi:hypothetical protein